MRQFKTLIYTPIPRNEIYLGLLFLRSFDVFLAITVLVLFTTQLSIGDFASILWRLLFISLLIQVKVLFDILISKLSFLWTVVVFLATLISFFGILVVFLYFKPVDMNLYLCSLALGLVNLVVWKYASQHIELKSILASVEDLRG